jgi:4-carboxymuconolactone decarboxylase
MARIPYFDPATAEGPRAREAFAKLPNFNIFRMLGHSGELIEAWRRFGISILRHLEVDPQLREVAILRTGVLSRATYEIAQHEEVCRKVGLSDAKIRAIHNGPDDAALSGIERLVMRFTDDVVLNVRAGDATFDPLLAALGAKQVQELLVTIGYYMMVSRFLETFDVDLD